jgi:hypothetical protein
MRGQDATDDRAVVDDDPDIGDFFDRLEELSETVDTPEERAVVGETLQLAADTQHRTALGRVIWGFDRADAAEALLGSLLLGIPMAVEGEGHRRWARSSPPARSSSPGPPCSRSCSRPACCTSPRSRMSVEDSLFGLVPRRLVGVLGISFVTGAVLLTAWGRVTWAAPGTALANVVVAFVPMSIGAALGDILPGS